MSLIKKKFVSRKINKVRWKPKDSSVVVTGTCEDEENNICIWKFPDLSMKQDGENEIDEDPLPVACLPFQGCVTDLNIVSDDLLVASSSLGSVFMIRYSDDEIHCTHTWERVHSRLNDTVIGRPTVTAVTGISVKGQDMVSVGEDGKLCVFNFNAKHNVREIDGSDLCSYTAVTYLRHQEICVGNSLGYLRLWDLRTASEPATYLLTLSREQEGVSCLAVHPTQPHIVAAGYEDGTLCVWDMRSERKPMSLLEGHSAAVTEMLFHPANPLFLYTGSRDGSVWQWDASGIKGCSAAGDSQNQTAAMGNPWLNCDANKQKLEVTCLSSSWHCVNTLDLSGSSLIWGTDNEELCILNNILV